MAGELQTILLPLREFKLFLFRLGVTAKKSPARLNAEQHPVVLGIVIGGLDNAITSHKPSSGVPRSVCV
jgi:hypothetical protein